MHAFAIILIQSELFENPFEIIRWSIPKIHNTLDSFEWLTTGDKFMYALHFELFSVRPYGGVLCAVRYGDRLVGIRNTHWSEMSTWKKKSTVVQVWFNCLRDVSITVQRILHTLDNNNNNKTPSHFPGFIEQMYTHTLTQNFHQFSSMCVFHFALDKIIIIVMIVRCTAILFFLSSSTCKPNHFFSCCYRCEKKESNRIR